MPKAPSAPVSQQRGSRGGKINTTPDQVPPPCTLGPTLIRLPSQPHSECRRPGLGLLGMKLGGGSRERWTGPDRGAAGRAWGLCGGGGPAWGLSRPGPGAPHPEQLLRWGTRSPRRVAHWPHQPQGRLLPASQTEGPNRNRNRKLRSRAPGLALPALRFPSWPRKAPWVPFTRGARGSEKLLQEASLLSWEACVTGSGKQASEPQSPSPGPGGRSLVGTPDPPSVPGGRRAMSPQTAGP